MPPGRTIANVYSRYLFVPEAMAVEGFFFQAEDGIRDLIVTGVQTCALPICSGFSAPGFGGWKNRNHNRATPSSIRGNATATRSEERRVGKECRSRWSAY